MYYIKNILNYLNKHYESEKQSKKKISDKEVQFCKQLIVRINKFTLSKRDCQKELFEKFQKTGLSVDSYISKYRIKDKNSFKRIVKGFETTPMKPIPKYQLVKESVFQKFEESRNRGENIHHKHLQKWSQNISASLNLKKPCNSVSFAESIKKKYRIVSRRIQENRNFNARSEEEIIESADRFVDTINLILPEYEPHNVWNADQTGINYEPTQKRTLEIKGTKLVASNVVSKNKTTHSFTVQPYVSLNGSFGSKLLIVLQEQTGGSFGPRIEPQVREVEAECGNVIVRCSKSGNMDVRLMDEWVAHFKRENPGNKLLLWDSLSFQRPEQYEVREGPERVENLLRIEQIPPSATKYAQPLDSLIIIQIKFLYKHLFWELQSVEQFEISRYVLIRLCSLVWNQLSNQRFSDLVKAGWSSCFYVSPVLNDNHKYYAKVKDVCLSGLSKCEMVFDDRNRNCPNDSVIRCSHCQKQFCIHHLFIEELHLHH